MKLPAEVAIDLSQCNEDLHEEICEYVSDYLCEKYGFCHEGFAIDIKITASDIMWDVDED